MEALGKEQKEQKEPPEYFCEYCDFKCFKKFNWTRHLMTSKHKESIFGSEKKEQKEQKEQNENIYMCKCGKIYSNSSGLWKHKQKCNQQQQDEKDEPTDKELILKILKQNSELIKENSELRKEQTDIKELILEIVKKGTHNTSNTNANNTTHTNSHNKAFNLNFFLNETCKNAMNINDFANSIKLQLSDLIDVGEVGYVEGISKIILKNLNNLDETERPIHCTDKKRETMYIKDEGQWEKEDEKKTKLNKVVTKIADKNIKLLPEFREKYPEYKNSSSKVSDKYDKMVIEVMTCDTDKNEKIMKKISNATLINKKIEQITI
jgi:hypothetical protein